jgi:ankyrin repeat protein
MSASDHAASSNAPRNRLPVKPSAEHLRKQAKRRAKAESIPLADAQHALAREYGSKNWAELMHVVETMLRGSDQSAHVKYEMEALPKAANASDVRRVREILATGAFTQHDLDLALARCVLRFREREGIARLLLDHGADPDGQYGSAYGPIVFVTGECLDYDGLKFLIDAGADVAFAPIDTKYGRHCPLSLWLGTYLRGRNDAKRRGIDLLLERGAHVPAEVTPELLAIHRDDAAKLAQRLDADPSLTTRPFERLPYAEWDAGTLLHYACEFGAGSCVDLLIARGADVNHRNPGGMTPLHCAARGGDADLVNRLLDAGARQWVADNDGKEPRHVVPDAAINPQRDAILSVLTEIQFGDDVFRDAVNAIDVGDVERLRRLLRDHPHLAAARVAGGDAITRGYFAKPTLLHFVANNPNRSEHMPPWILESTASILDAAAEVDASTNHALGGTTLALVASSGPAHADGLVTPLLELLVSRGADPTHGLAAALLHRFTDTARTLLRLGDRHTPLSAAALGETDALRELLARETPKDDLRYAGWAAAMNGQTETLLLLLDAGLDANAILPRPFDVTLLHEAAWHNHGAVVDLLLSRGADPSRRDSQYKSTPAGWAAHAGHAKLAERLRSAEAARLTA